MTDKVIYERLDASLPEWARWIAKDYDGYIYLGAREPTVHMKYWASIEGKETRISPHDTYYAIPGPWHKSLRRIIRITEPEWYSPDNDQCDDEGWLPHDGGPMPEWVRGKMVKLKWGGRTSHENEAEYWFWENATHGYRIVSEEHAEVVSDPGDDPAYPTPADGMILGLTQANYAAIHLGMPVPGMSDWLHKPLREARRLRYREAALSGWVRSMADRHNEEGYSDSGASVYASRCASYAADAMIAQENDDVES